MGHTGGRSEKSTLWGLPSRSEQANCGRH